MVRHVSVCVWVVLAAFFVTGCNLLLEVESYHLVETDANDAGNDDAGSDDGGSGSCQDGSGFHGLGCWACTPVTNQQFLNQCSSSVCTPFDRARLTALLLDGGLPRLPDAGPTGGEAGETVRPDTGSLDAGSLDAGSIGAGSLDAGSLDGRISCHALPNPLVITGSTAMKPFISRLGARLGNANPPITLVYQSVGSCVGAKAVVEDVPAVGVATWWDPVVAESASERTCALPPGGLTVDIGVSDVFAASCGVQNLPANVGDFPGPIQTMALVAPIGSSQNTISAEAAYLIYGLGAGSGVDPWTDETYLFQRGAHSGTQSLISSVIGLAPTQWRGVSTKNSDDMLAKLLGVPAAKVDSALGILSTDYADAHRDTLKILAFQDYGQACAMYPDSTKAALDKANVRSGQYPLWGPVHFLVRTNTQTGAIVSSAAAAVVGYLDGSRHMAGLDLIQHYAQRHLVPPCAMRVKRIQPLDGAVQKAELPSQGCGCYFDAQVTGRNECLVCSAARECPPSAPHCSFGYCEK